MNLFDMLQRFYPPKDTSFHEKSPQIANEAQNQHAVNESEPDIDVNGDRIPNEGDEKQQKEERERLECEKYHTGLCPRDIPYIGRVIFSNDSSRNGKIIPYGIGDIAPVFFSYSSCSPALIKRLKSRKDISYNYRPYYVRYVTIVGFKVRYSKGTQIISDIRLPYEYREVIAGNLTVYEPPMRRFLQGMMPSITYNTQIASEEVLFGRYYDKLKQYVYDVFSVEQAANAINIELYNINSKDYSWYCHVNNCIGVQRVFDKMALTNTSSSRKLSSFESLKSISFVDILKPIGDLITDEYIQKITDYVSIIDSSEYIDIDNLYARNGGEQTVMSMGDQYLKAWRASFKSEYSKQAHLDSLLNSLKQLLYESIEKHLADNSYYHTLLSEGLDYYDIKNFDDSYSDRDPDRASYYWARFLTHKNG